MAWYRQASQPWQGGGIDTSIDGGPRSPSRMHDHGKGHSALVKTRAWKSKRLARPTRRGQISIGVFAVLFFAVVVISIFGADYVFTVIRAFRGETRSSGLSGSLDEDTWQSLDPKLERVVKSENIVAHKRESVDYTERESGDPWQTHTSRQSGSDDESTMAFKHGTESLNENLEQDWRSWDKDDRVRESLAHQDEVINILKNIARLDKSESTQALDSKIQQHDDKTVVRDTSKNTGLYDEGDQVEHEEQFVDKLVKDVNVSHYHRAELNRKQGKEGISSLNNQKVYGEDPDDRLEEVDIPSDTSHRGGLALEAAKQFSGAAQEEYKDEAEEEDEDEDGEEAGAGAGAGAEALVLQKDGFQQEGTDEQHIQRGKEKAIAEQDEVQRSANSAKDTPREILRTSMISDSRKSSNFVSGTAELSTGENVKTGSEKEEVFVKKNVTAKARRKKKTRPVAACDIAFVNTTDELQEPTDMTIFQNLSLNYIHREENLEGDRFWEPKFGGHQSLKQREESYLAKDQTLHCGFVKGTEGYPDTGFELTKDDMDYLQTCHIAVSSCIFGNYDRIRHPSKKVSNSSKEKVCFAMFVDQQSLEGMISEGEVPDKNMTLGLWRVVVVNNLPYSDNRRTGKVPKFLTHRLFPNAKYSIWLDSKLRLQSDPLEILEHFLWRGKHEYAISNHYDRHCVWEEVAQNKKLNKFNHKVIDEQFDFYLKDGLIRFNASDPHMLLPSHVPEGSFIIRAHTPMSNLFSCLWFNEVERFTPRDQLSFAYTYLKFVRMNPSKQFRFNMFKDCERKAMAKLFHHKKEEEAKGGKP